MEIHLSLHSSYHYQIVYAKLNLKIEYPMPGIIHLVCMENFPKNLHFLPAKLIRTHTHTYV